jgi:ribosomal protein L29
MKAMKDLRNSQAWPEIAGKLTDARDELMKLRFQQVTGQLTDTSRVTNAAPRYCPHGNHFTRATNR